MENLMMDLQLFTGHSVTVYKDGGFSAASASPNSSVAAEADVTLSWTLASGYELDEIEVVAGGPITINMTTKKFAMPDDDVALNFKSKANNKYKIVENCDVWINGSKTHLQRNMTLEKGKNGAIVGVTSTGTAITLSSEIVANLVKAGTIIKI